MDDEESKSKLNQTRSKMLYSALDETILDAARQQTQSTTEIAVAVMDSTEAILEVSGNLDKQFTDSKKSLDNFEKSLQQKLLAQSKDLEEKLSRVERLQNQLKQGWEVDLKARENVEIRIHNLRYYLIGGALILSIIIPALTWAMIYLSFTGRR